MKGKVMKYKLNQKIKLALTEEQGIVIGIADYAESEEVGTRYYVRYKAGDGRQVEEWFTDGALRSLGESELVHGSNESNLG